MNANDLKKRYALSIADLPDPQGVNVYIIQGVDTEYYEAKENGRIIEQCRQILRLHNAPRPLRLNNTRIDSIISLLGAETDDWIGKKIGIAAGPVSAFGQTKMDLVIHLQSVQHLPAVMPPRVGFTPSTQLPAAASSPAGKAAPALPAAPLKDDDALPPAMPDPFDSRPLGGQNAMRFEAALAEQGATHDDFHAWLESNGSPLAELVRASKPYDWPRGAVQAMQKFLRVYGQLPAKLAEPPPVHPDDIPF